MTIPARKPALAAHPLPTSERGCAGAGAVFVIDDDEHMRRVLCRLLSFAGLTARAFPNADEFLQSNRAHGPACLVLDLQMPDMTGLELQEELRARGIRIPIIFLTGAGTIVQAVSAMDAGAVGFLEKPFRNEELVALVRKALGVDRNELQQDTRRSLITHRVAALTSREKEVMVHLSKGEANKVIARALQISSRTVEGHRARLMDKLEVTSAAELVHIVEKGMV